MAASAVTLLAPVAANGLVAQRFFHETGTKTYDTSGDFTGEAITYSLDGSPPSGVTINSSTGVVSVDTDAITRGFYQTSITVRATNSAGFDTSSFNLSVCAVHAVTATSGNGPDKSFDLSSYPSTNRRVWIFNSTQTLRTLTVDGVSVSPSHYFDLTAEASRHARIYTSDTSEATVDLTYSAALSGGLDICFVTYGYGSALADTASDEDATGADSSTLTDINVPVGGAVMACAHQWETFLAPASGFQRGTADNFAVWGCRTVEAGDATFDLQVGTDTSDTDKIMWACSLTPLAA